MVVHPERVDAARDGGQVICPDQGGRRMTSVQDLACETDFEFGHASSRSGAGGLSSIRSTMAFGEVLIRTRQGHAYSFLAGVRLCMCDLRISAARPPMMTQGARCCRLLRGHDRSVGDAKVLYSK